MRIWRVGIARNAVFFHSFVASPAGKASSYERAGAEHLLPKMLQNLHHACARERFGSQHRSKLTVREHFWKLQSPKFAPRLRVSTIWKSKSLKTGMVGALLEVAVAKICTTPACEHDLEVKIVKDWHGRSIFGSCSRRNLHHACA